MMLSNDFMNQIRVFGLNSYEAKIWVALLSRGVSTAGELSDISNVPRSRAYDVLESLEKKGFIITKIGKPIKYLAISPGEVLSRVQNKIHENATTKSQILENVKGTDVLDELHLLYSQGVDFVSPNDMSGSFRGRQGIYQQLDYMIKSAEKSILLVTTTEGLNRKVKSFYRTLAKAKERGIDIKVAAPISNDNESMAEKLREIAEVKHLADIDSRFMIVDSKELMFMVSEDKGIHSEFDVGIWVNTGFFAQALQSMFDIKWNKLD